ncbi:MAG: pantoate--beta-alanine ligase [Bacteroidetes bacterium]|nr:pantoate--beta-alanine ligase [Bacteroidota bacterium]
MKLFLHQSDLKKYLHSVKKQGHSIGFVPTMGALHAGHISLIQQSKTTNDLTVCSIFVNPTQFNDSTDLAKYPRTTEADISMLLAAECEVLYLPQTKDVYGDVVKVQTQFDFEGLDTGLEGSSRPGHFAGVAQVVKLLLEIVQPDILYLGQKDYQQWAIINKMNSLLNLSVQVVRCPIYREENGLAMSSRNSRLSVEARGTAGIIYTTLQWAISKLAEMKFDTIEMEARKKIDANADFKTDYFKILNAENLKPMVKYNEQNAFVIVTAVVVEGIRLLDNVVKETT